MLNWPNKELAVLLQKIVLHIEAFRNFCSGLFLELLQWYVSQLSDAGQDTLQLLPIRTK